MKKSMTSGERVGTLESSFERRALVGQFAGAVVSLAGAARGLARPMAGHDRAGMRIGLTIR